MSYGNQNNIQESRRPLQPFANLSIDISTHKCTIELKLAKPDINKRKAGESMSINELPLSLSFYLLKTVHNRVEQNVYPEAITEFEKMRLMNNEFEIAMRMKDCFQNQSKEISHEEELDAFYKSCKQILREDVSVEEMANILDNFMFDYDPYHYEDTIGKETEAREAEKERLAKDISNGEVQSIINFLRKARDEASDIPTQNICEQLQVELAKLELRLKDPVEYEKAFPTRYYNTELDHAKLKKHEMER